MTLPHDWSIAQPPQPETRANATGYFPGGLGWYRKTFTLPAWMAGKQISIDFDGVFDNSYVYLNGHLLGNHPYGYTGYSYDITGWSTPTATRRTCSRWSSRTRSRAAAGTRGAGSPATST